MKLSVFSLVLKARYKPFLIFFPTKLNASLRIVLTSLALNRSFLLRMV